MLFREVQTLWSNRIATIGLLVGGTIVVVLVLHLIFGKPIWTWRPSDMLVVGLIGGSVAGLVVLSRVIRLTTTVTPLFVEAALTFCPVRRLATAEIVAAEPVRYRPWRDYLGWGLRFAGPSQSAALTISGNRGVVVTTAGGRTLLIGSQRPERLASAILEAAGAPSE